MPMFEGKNDYGKNMWESTITIKRKHFLNMVKKYYKDIMDEDVKAKYYSYTTCWDYGLEILGYFGMADYYYIYQIKIIKTGIINSVPSESEYILNEKDLGNVFDYNIGKHLGNYELNTIDISSPFFQFQVKTDKNLGQKVKIKK